LRHAPLSSSAFTRISRRRFLIKKINSAPNAPTMTMTPNAESPPTRAACDVEFRDVAGVAEGVEVAAVAGVNLWAISNSTIDDDKDDRSLEIIALYI
jgi:hypothetical protein